MIYKMFGVKILWSFGHGKVTPPNRVSRRVRRWFAFSRKRGSTVGRVYLEDAARM